MRPTGKCGLVPLDQRIEESPTQKLCGWLWSLVSCSAKAAAVALSRKLAI